MTYSDYSLTYTQYQNYKSNQGDAKNKLKEIWEDLLRRIEDEKLKNEAEDKGFELVSNPEIEDDEIANYMMIQVPNASKELDVYIVENLYPYVVCLLEDEDEEDIYY